jgi:hypothetical protein
VCVRMSRAEAASVQGLDQRLGAQLHELPPTPRLKKPHCHHKGPGARTGARTLLVHTSVLGCWVARVHSFV